MYFEGSFSTENKQIAIVVSRFNSFVTKELLEGAQDCLLRHGLSSTNLTIAWTPGAFEIPLAAQKIAQTNKYDAIICLGAVIRGSTSHFDYVCAEAAKGVSATALKYGIPVTFGILTTDTTDQAMERAGIKHGNKGWEAAMAALEMANLLETIEHDTTVVKTTSIKEVAQ